MIQVFNGKPSEWNSLVARLPGPHLLQTWEWAQVKAKYGWQPIPVTWTDGDKLVSAAMLLKRVIPVGGFARRMGIMYVPKGPLMDWTNASLRQAVLGDLQQFARKQGAIFLKIDPDVVLGKGIPGSDTAQEETSGHLIQAELQNKGWGFSQEQVQFRNTLLVDLSASEEDLLGRMKQKTRYNIRLADKKGVKVRVGTSSDLLFLYKLYAETSVRDGFVIREEAYYRSVWDAFMRSPEQSPARPGEPFCEPMIAEVEGQTVAAIFVFYFAGRAYYLYGMSHDAHREKMPNYLLQWEAMRRAKAIGCTHYDLWGAPDEFNEKDGMWGVFRFKEGLGGEVVRTLGAWDFPISPVLYRLYTRTLPRILDLMRSRGKKRTQQDHRKRMT